MTQEQTRPDHLLDYVKELAPASKRLAEYALALEAVVVEQREALELYERVVRAAQAHVEARRTRGPSAWPELLDALAALSRLEAGRD